MDRKLGVELVFDSYDEYMFSFLEYKKKGFRIYEYGLSTSGWYLKAKKENLSSKPENEI